MLLSIVWLPRYNPIVMEGAGSISEINLRDTDLVNMPMACYAGADVLLVADIDRGGGVCQRLWFGHAANA